MRQQKARNRIHGNLNGVKFKGTIVESPSKTPDVHSYLDQEAREQSDSDCPSLTPIDEDEDDFMKNFN